MSTIAADELRARLESAVLDTISAATGQPFGADALAGTVDELDIDSVILVDVLYALESTLEEELDESLLQMLMDGITIRQLIDSFVEGRTG